MTMAAGRRNPQGRIPDIEAKERDLRDREERLAQVCTGDMWCWCFFFIMQNLGTKLCELVEEYCT